MPCHMFLNPRLLTKSLNIAPVQLFHFICSCFLVLAGFFSFFALILICLSQFLHYFSQFSSFSLNYLSWFFFSQPTCSQFSLLFDFHSNLFIDTVTQYKIAKIIFHFKKSIHKKPFITKEFQNFFKTLLQTKQTAIQKKT